MRRKWIMKRHYNHARINQMKKSDNLGKRMKMRLDREREIPRHKRFQGLVKCYTKEENIGS